VTILAAAGCGSVDETEHWRDQLSAAGPCWDVNLGDGIDDPDELGLLLTCVDQSGDFTPLRPLVQAMSLSAADGASNWSHVEALVSAAPDADLSVGSLLDAALLLLDQDPGVFGELLDVSVELLYGRAFDRLVAGDVELAQSAELDRGVLAPMLPPVRAVARAMLDDPGGSPALLGDLMAAQGTRDALCTLVGIARSTDPTIGPLADRVLSALGAAIALTRDADNDRWADASGDSLRDLADALFDGRDASSGALWLDSGRPAFAAMLGDTGLRDRMADALLALHAGDHIAPLFQQMRHLAELDAQGTSLDLPPEDAPPGARVSALASFLRLIDSGSRPVTCVGVGFDNLSVTLLQLLAGLDADTVEFGVGVLGPLLDSWLGGLSLEVLAFACDGVDDEMVWDLESIDRFNDPETGDLLVILLGVLDAVAPEDGSPDRVSELVDVLALAWRAGLVPPAEEALRDVGNTDLARDVAQVLPLVVDPSPLEVAECPTGSQPLDFEALWDIAEVTLVGDDGPAALDTLRPVAAPVLEDHATWIAVGNLGALLRDEGARLRQAPDLGARLVAADPDLAVFDDLSVAFGDDALLTPTLNLLGSVPLSDAVSGTTPDRPGPMPWFARLVLDDTLARTIDTLRLAVSWLEGLQADDGGSGDEAP